MSDGQKLKACVAEFRRTNKELNERLIKAAKSLQRVREEQKAESSRYP